ncbi:aldehyde dehydrogenase family protein [Crossiella sp. SN42]|uniref:aldehyde dehydrogenase family protein n=1 Tax=Crossiella sp. SN42 TaxID=2944808 RepID=UPI00207D62A4|nr:aldehyde dehydrogenase family protein [Crossiella sp. SN42]MCO1582470.1 aldehyde dehydrogenase family protein [Crossiella sp. SN42]
MANELIEVINPATEQVIGSVPAGTAADVDAAVRAAHAAFPAWAATPLAERAELGRRIAAGVAARRDELAKLITAEMGSPISFSTRVQASLPVAVASGFVDLVDQGYDFSEEIGNSLVLREPIGVVGAITPWNYPLHQVVAKVVPALVAGCTVVLKPSEVTPLTAEAFAGIVREAGVPDGVFHLVHGYGPTVGEAIVAHPLVDMISFTGSTAAGRRISAVGAETVKRVSLELGGKSANIILDDADLAGAAKQAIAHCFINSGQTCTARTRALIPARLHEEFVGLLTEAAAKYVPGDPTDPATRIGPMVTKAQQERVQGYIRQGVAEGATLAVGGPETPAHTPVGYYVQPTVFANVRNDMVIAQEEIFGPVLAVLPYADEDDAVAIANDSIYGLAGSVYSADADRALAVARRMRTGQVDINGGAFNPVAPFGGYKQSGNGREMGLHGLEEFTELKAIQR